MNYKLSPLINMAKKTNRCKTDLIAAILLACKKERNCNTMLRISNIAWNTLNKYYPILIEKDLLKESIIATKRRYGYVRKFKTTEKGLKYLNYYKKIQMLIS